jgi:hypothetical protein
MGTGTDTFSYRPLQQRPRAATDYESTDSVTFSALLEGRRSNPTGFRKRLASLHYYYVTVITLNKSWGRYFFFFF